MLAHTDLAAEARITKPKKQMQNDESDSEVEDELNERTRPAIELVDMGGGHHDDADDATEEVPIGEVSSFPLTDVASAHALCFQEDELAFLHTQRRKSKSDESLRELHETYAPLYQLAWLCRPSLHAEAHLCPCQELQEILSGA